jgi:transposase
MARPLVPDHLWALIEPLLPPRPPRPKGGRPPLDDRRVLAGIIFVLRSGIPWEMLPQEMGCGSGMTCWRRLRDWQQAGIWQRIHELLLAELHAAGKIDWNRASVDSSSVPAPGGGPATGPNPTDRGKKGTKRHIAVDRNGLPLGVVISGANDHDSIHFEATIDAVPPVRGRVGRPRRRPHKVHADKAYDFQRCRRACRRRGITPRIARRGVESKERLGRVRWTVERTMAWLNRFRRLRIRYERRDDIYFAFVLLALILINVRLLGFC